MINHKHFLFWFVSTCFFLGCEKSPNYSCKIPCKSKIAIGMSVTYSDVSVGSVVGMSVDSTSCYMHLYLDEVVKNSVERGIFDLDIIDNECVRVVEISGANKDARSH